MPFSELLAAWLSISCADIFCWEAHEKGLSLKSVTKPENTQFCQRWSDQGYGYEDDRDPMNGLLSPGAPGVTWSSTRY